jgi:hypothetical protein
VNPANTLIPLQEQADESDAILEPGERPFVIPWCASCKEGVETFTFDVVTNVFRAGLHATCHGKTESVWLTPEDLLARKRDGKPVVMFKRGAFDRVR